MIAPRKQKVATSKIPANQRRTEQPFCHRLAHHLAFTKYGQEPRFVQNAARRWMTQNMATVPMA
jgi:hypothetical protein